MDVASMVAEESGLIMEYLYQVLATSLQNPRPRSHHLPPRSVRYRDILHQQVSGSDR